MYKNTYESINDHRNNFLEENESFSLPLMKYPNYELYNFDLNNSIYEDNTLNNNDHISPYYLIDQAKIEKKSITKGIKSTTTKTFKTIEEKNAPELFTPSDILNIFNKHSNKDKFSENIKKLKFKEDIVNTLRLTGRKRQREDFENDNINNELEDDKNKKKRGRKKTKLNRFEIHDKMCPDNIIRKVKTSIFNYILYFLNNLLSSVGENYSLNNTQLLRLNHKNIMRLKKNKEFEILSMSLKDIFSKDISPKYNNGKYSNDFNKKIIENILNNNCNNTIIFAFNITLRDWLDFFTLKKSLEDIINKYNNINYNIDFDIIEKSLVGIDNLLNIINNKNDEDYLTLFILCLYNYERWFYLKKQRNRNEEEKKI